MYVDEGYLAGIESYTYGDEWPEPVDTIEFHELKLGMELGNTGRMP